MRRLLFPQRSAFNGAALIALLAAAVSSCGPDCYAIESIPLPARHGQEAGVIDCDCAGCRAYLDSCEQPPSCDVWQSDDCLPAAPSQQPAPYAPEAADEDAESVEPGDAEPDASPSPDEREPLSGAMPSLASMGALASTGSAAPHMIGDLFGSFEFHSIFSDDYSQGIIRYDEVTVPAGLGGAPGANVGRQKMGENGGSIPRDRFINNFSYFKNTPLLPEGQDVTRNVVGLEKTFFEGLTSLEFRVPFASTLDNNVAIGPDGVIGDTNGELGNMTLYGKLLLIENRRYAVATGLGVTAPTADDFVLREEDGTELLRVENESPHLLPFIGVVVTPNADLFYQAFVQVDVDTQGNGVQSSVEDNFPGESQFVGRLRDRDLLFVDMSLGYWLHRDPHSAVITGLAPIVEIHYNTATSDGDALQTNVFQSAEAESFDLVNGVVGTIIQFDRTKNLMLAYTTPLSGGDEQFDGEFRMSFNWFFGPSAQRFGGYAF